MNYVRAGQPLDYSSIIHLSYTVHANHPVLNGHPSDIHYNILHTILHSFVQD